MADTSARITRVDSLVASPGCCAVCGKSEHGDGFASTDNFDFEFYGTVYFCADCVGDYARLFGYKSPSELDDLSGRMADQETELAVLRKAVVLLENTLDNFTGLSDLRRDHIVPGHGDGTLIVANVPEPAADVDISSGSGEGDQLTFDEPSSEPRSDDVRDATSADSELADLLA